MVEQKAASGWRRMANRLGSPLVSTVKQVVGPLGKTYLAWIAIHYLSAHAYAHLCTPTSIQGFLLSPMLAVSPHCSALRWAVGNGGSALNTMWLAVGGWAASRLMCNDKRNALEKKIN